MWEPIPWVLEVLWDLWEWRLWWPMIDRPPICAMVGGMSENDAQRMILASGSPRRREMMAEAGVDFEVIPSDADELHDDSMDLFALCEVNAELKAKVVAERHPGRLVIGSDTLVAIDGVKLAKPADMDEARRMLWRLSGRTHEVCSAVALVRSGERPVSETFHVISKVTFKELSDEVIDAYYREVDPLDKAGAYAVQQCSELIIEKIDGDYHTIVGMPVAETLERVKRWL